VITERGLLDETEVGPKFANQARMAEVGLPVPRFFCLPAALFRAVTEPVRGAVESVLVGVNADDVLQVAKAADEIRDMFLELDLPGEIEQAVLAAFDDAFGPTATVSVRSSLLGAGGRGEDSGDDAMAGISDSFLYVRRDQVMDRVRRCWASAFNEQAILHRAVQGVGPRFHAVAVGVQEMVDGTRSFVVFTSNPRSGMRDAVVAAGLGIGEGVVQEKVPIDHYFVDRGTQEIRRSIVPKTERMQRDPSATALTPALTQVDAETARRPALSDEEVRAVCALGDRCERLFDHPQDVEGTITADGRIHVLQSRPIVFDHSRQRLWSNANITESFPGNTTALTYSFARQFYLEDFRSFYRLLGVGTDDLLRREDDLHHMIGLLNGRVYYALDAWYRLHRMSPLFPAWRSSWQRMMGMSPSVYDARRDVVGTGLGELTTAADAVRRLIVLRARHTRAAKDFLRWWGPTVRRHRDALATADAFTAVRLMRSLWSEVRARWGLTLINDFFLQTTTDLTSALFLRWLPNADGGLHSDLLCGDEENVSVTILLSTLRLAEQGRHNPAFTRDGAEESPAVVWERLRVGAYGTGFADDVQEHVQRFGDRGLQELKLEVPGPRQDPAQTVATLVSYGATELTAAEVGEREKATRRVAERRLEHYLRGQPVRLRALRALLDSQRKCVAFRENSRYARSELFGFAKDVFRLLGQELVDRGVLDSVDDVHHLQQDELFGYFDGTGITEDLRALAALRRTEYEHRSPELPMNFATHGPVRDSLPGSDSHDTDATVLSGLGSSGGVFRGVARIVLDPHEAVKVDDKTILVARETDPGWIFLMLAVGGIIVERGTMLSHTAITGRKFGIPTIVAVPHATTRIQDGDLLEMNGATGAVRIVERSRS